MKRFVPGKCFYCDVDFNRQPKGRVALIDTAETVDHVYSSTVKLPPALLAHPLGREALKNKVRACHRCNHDKGKKHPRHWLTVMAPGAGVTRLAKLLLELGETSVHIAGAVKERIRYYGRQEDFSDLETHKEGSSKGSPVDRRPGQDGIGQGPIGKGQGEIPAVPTGKRRAASTT